MRVNFHHAVNVYKVQHLCWQKLLQTGTFMWDLRLPQQFCWCFRFSGMWRCVAR